EHELAARLFFDRHGERVAPRALVDGLDADDGPARPAEEFGGRLGRCLVRDAHDVAALAAVAEEPEDAVSEIAVADEVAEDVAELPPTVDGLRVVQRAALGLPDEARHAHAHERRLLDPPMAFEVGHLCDLFLRPVEVIGDVRYLLGHLAQGVAHYPSGGSPP